MNIIRLLLLSFSFLLSTGNSVFAQDNEMADVMRTNGKIYVVVGVLLIILVGIIVYLISLDRKIQRIEKERN
ncbi:MAG: hypothetical protein RIQ47_1013 [Bacteroidota bacterium]|jgi:uncharacterized membrane protein